MGNNSKGTYAFILVALAIFVITQFSPVKNLFKKNDFDAYFKKSTPVVDTAFYRFEIKSVQDKDKLKKIDYSIKFTAKTNLTVFNGDVSLVKLNKNKTDSFDSIKFQEENLYLQPGEYKEWKGILYYKNKIELFDDSVFGIYSRMEIRYPVEDKDMSNEQLEADIKSKPEKYTVKANAVCTK